MRKLLKFVSAVLLLSFGVSTRGEVISQSQAATNADICDTAMEPIISDSNVCLMVDGTLLIDGEKIIVKRIRSKIILRKSPKFVSAGDKTATYFVARGLKLRIIYTILPGCDHRSDQCTFYGYKAQFKLSRTGKKTIIYEGLGEAGS